jgi:hypothetical protein
MAVGRAAGRLRSGRRAPPPVAAPGPMPTPTPPPKSQTHPSMSQPRNPPPFAVPRRRLAPRVGRQQRGQLHMRQPGGLPLSGGSCWRPCRSRRSPCGSSPEGVVPPARCLSLRGGSSCGRPPSSTRKCSPEGGGSAGRPLRGGCPPGLRAPGRAALGRSVPRFKAGGRRRPPQRPSPRAARLLADGLSPPPPPPPPPAVAPAPSARAARTFRPVAFGAQRRGRRAPLRRRRRPVYPKRPPFNFLRPLRPCPTPRPP